MPEPEKAHDDAPHSDRTSKVLQFFSAPVKEQKKEKMKPLSKVVIRRLPPRLTKEAFLSEFVLPAHDLFYFVRGDLNLGPYAFSRAYVNITNPDDIFAFREKYDDHPLQDEQGREYHAVVEWAPQQRVPKKTVQKKFSKSGTLEADPKYIEFLEKLEQEKTSQGNTSEYFMETDSVTTKEVKVTTTPLLEYIKLKRQQKIDIRNENRIRKREAEKEKRRKEDDMRRAEKQRKEKDKPSPKVEAKAVEQDTGKPPVKEKEVVDRKKPEPKSPRIAKSEVKTKEEKFEKKPKVTRKNESDSRIPRGDEKAPPKPVNSRKLVGKEEKAVAPPSSEGKTRSSAETKKEPVRTVETKSKFRYSEQRNRDRTQKASTESKGCEETGTEEKEDTREDDKDKSKDGISRQSTQESDGSGDGDETRMEGQGGRKDPRVERRIRNKDRPAMQIYRPGMGRFSKQRIDVKDSDIADTKKDDAKDEPTPKPERIKDNDIKPFRTKKILDNPDIKAVQPAPIVKKLDVVEKPSPEAKDVTLTGDELKEAGPITPLEATELLHNDIEGECKVLRAIDKLSIGEGTENAGSGETAVLEDVPNNVPTVVSSTADETTHINSEGDGKTAVSDSEVD